MVMKWQLFLCFSIVSLKGYAQVNPVAGIVFDKESKDRIASVLILNSTTKQSVYNNLKGEFHMNARPGDQLIFTRYDYLPDTIIIKNNTSLAIYMARTAIQLKEVVIKDTLLSPEKRLEATKLNYSKIYGSLGYRDFLSVPSSGGAGLSIDALWNTFSRSGRNADRLKQIIDNDYKQNVIDYRFNRTLVGSITGLKDNRLTDFMQKYRPGYYTTITMSDYEFIVLVRANFKRYLRRPRVYELAPLISK